MIQGIKKSLTLLVPTIALLMATSPASADPGNVSNGGAKVVERTKDGASFVLVPRYGVAKDAYDPDELATRLRGSRPEVSATSYDVQFSNNSSIPLGNGSVYSNFNGDWTMTANNSQAIASWGDEHGTWSGTVPAYYADYMDLSGSYAAWAYESSFSVSVPAGFTYSVSGSQAQSNWANRYYNTWSVEHYYQPGPAFYPGDRVTRILQSSGTSATFGSSTYSTTTPTSSQWL